MMTVEFISAKLMEKAMAEQSVYVPPNHILVTAAEALRKQQAEIARLQAEVERLKEDEESDAKLKDDLYAQTITAHNDAIEAAAQECECLYHSSLSARFPQWNEACVESAKAIRALKK